MNAMTYSAEQRDAQQARDASPRTQALGTADAPSDEPAGRGTLPPSLRRAIPIGVPWPVAVAYGTAGRS